MSLKDLKSDLSKFRNPFKTPKVSKQHSSNKVSKFKTKPLAEKTIPKILNITTNLKKSSVEISKNNSTSGRHTKGIETTNDSKLDGRHNRSIIEINKSNLSENHNSGKEVKNNSNISGRHNKGIETTNDSKLDGRHNVGENVTNESNISGRHNVGNEIKNESNISGRHNVGENVTNESNISGRHNVGENVTNDSKLSGRHLTDNSNQNIDGNPSLTNPSGRHLTDNSNQNIDGNPPLTNPSGRHKISPTQIKDVNFFSDINAVGFTSKFQPGSITKYKFGTSLLQTSQNGIASVNFIKDTLSGGTGFTPNQETTQYLGITRGQYIYPETVNGGRLMSIGNAKLTSQLGEGTEIPNAGQFVGHPVKLKLSGAGFHVSRKYESVVSKIKLSALGTQYEQKNSPSFFDVLYNQFNLRDDSPQWGWINHPLILRGIQRKNNSDVQRWGYGVGGFDDGLIRGGMATALDRTIIDTARIAKFMASPRGLMWILKNAGLGLTNPKVETIVPGPFGRQTRIHTGLTSLLSVAGGTFGLHFTTHGIPFLNEVASYSNVQRIKMDMLTYSETKLKVGLLSNRLVNLKHGPTAGLNSPIILNLSGLAGPGSVYGIGGTIIHRYEDSEQGIKRLKSGKVLAAINKPFDSSYEFEGLLTYNFGNQYAAGMSLSPHKSTSGTFKKKRTTKDIERKGLKQKVTDAFGNAGIKKGPFKELYPFKTKPNNPTSNPTAKPTNTDEFNTVVTGIKAYSTLAYNNIPRDSFDKKGKAGKDSAEFYDFRKHTEGQTKKQGEEANYTKNNIVDKFGYGEQGQVGVDRSNYKATAYDKSNRTLIASKFRGDKINAVDAHIEGKGLFASKKITYDKIYNLLGQETPSKFKDTVPFFFAGPNKLTNNREEEVLVFRNTVNNFTDTFSPSWNSTQILGRADAVHSYNTWGRSVSFDFKLQATSRDEMKPLWRKLNYLASWTTPRYSSGLMRGGYVRFTLGHLFQEIPCFINSMTVTIDADTTWEINLDNDDDMLQLPHGVNVSMGLTMLMDYRPQWNSRLYSISSRGKVDADNPKTNWLHDSTVEKN